MPQKTVYIRDKDLAKWVALENKAAWLSKKLNERSSNNEDLNKDPYEEQKINTTEPIPQPLAIHVDERSSNNPRKQLDLTSILAAKRIKTCSHGYAKGLCKFGC